MPDTLTSALGQRGPAIEALALQLLSLMEDPANEAIFRDALEIAQVLSRALNQQRFDEEKAIRDAEQAAFEKRHPSQRTALSDSLATS